MKVNMVTAKPADGGAAVCLLISETADPVLDFFTKLRAADGVLKKDDGSEERFSQIALFQRPNTTKRSRFEHPADPRTSADGGEEKKNVAPAAKKKKAAALKAAEKEEEESEEPPDGGEEEESGV